MSAWGGLARRGTACLTHIFSRKNKKEEKRILAKLGKGSLEFKYPGSGTNGGGGSRGKITGFSRQSRKGMMIRLTNLREMPMWWQTFTVPDDVLQGLTIEEKSRITSSFVKDFKRELEKNWPLLWGVWRREWEPRKTGELKGAWCPHFHVFFYLEGVTEETYRMMAVHLAHIWVHVVGTSHPGALSVAVNEKSYEWLHSLSQAIGYTSKYMAKVLECFQGDQEKEQSLGRMWGYIGKPEFCEFCTREIGYQDGIWLKRYLKKYVLSRWRRKAKKKPGEWKIIKRVLKGIQSGNMWLLIPRETVLDMIWNALHQEIKSSELMGCPF